MGVNDERVAKSTMNLYGPECCHRQRSGDGNINTQRRDEIHLIGNPEVRHPSCDKIVSPTIVHNSKSSLHRVLAGVCVNATIIQSHNQSLSYAKESRF